MFRKLALNSLIGLVVLASAQSLSGQTHGPASTQIEAMKKMNFLVGEWKGEGWTEFVPGNRGTASITEKVQSKMGGMVMLIEGLGKAKIPGESEEKVVHNAMAVMWYDQQAKIYRLRSFLIDGRAVDAEASFIGEAFQWRFKSPYGSNIRYTIKLTEKGEWFEFGEMSEDGNSWRKFHEMTLQRVK